jgi:hypothetical protein
MRSSASRPLAMRPNAARKKKRPESCPPAALRPVPPAEESTGSPPLCSSAALRGTHIPAEPQAWRQNILPARPSDPPRAPPLLAGYLAAFLHSTICARSNGEHILILPGSCTPLRSAHPMGLAPAAVSPSAQRADRYSSGRCRRSSSRPPRRPRGRRRCAGRRSSAARAGPSGASGRARGTGPIR